MSDLNKNKNTLDITLDGGKYRYLFHDNGGSEVLRYGEPWRDTTGDGFILEMAFKIEALEAQLRAATHLAEAPLTKLKP